jgi:hypothetical protein
MNTNSKLFLLLIAVVFLLYLLRRCPGNDKGVTTRTTTQTTTTIHIDTLIFHDTVYFPTPYKVVELRIDTLYIDTSRTIREYFTDKYYLFTWQDSVLKATGDIKVSKNAIELAMFDYEVYRPTIHTTTIITEKSVRRFFFSAGVGINYSITQHRAGVELLAAIGIKRQNIHIGYDFINQTPRIGWQYQIK